ncbi:MAG: RpiB/LacA/LacB family sugar-phosphate isomerase [Adlercreutzia equolifaciens]
MRVSIGSDHAGFEQKQALVDYLVGKGYDVIDRGPDNDDRVDYPDYAAPVAHDVADGVAERGVLVCGTGIGMAMAADKVPGDARGQHRQPRSSPPPLPRAQRRERASPFPAAS